LKKDVDGRVEPGHDVPKHQCHWTFGRQHLKRLAGTPVGIDRRRELILDQDDATRFSAVDGDDGNRAVAMACIRAN